MLRQVKEASDLSRQPDVTVDILGLATSVPSHRLSQDDALAQAKRLYPHFSRLDDLFGNTGVSNRYTVEPSEWYDLERSWEERTASFQRNALALLEDVTRRAIEAAGIALFDIDVVITNTITGLSIPSLDARLMNRLGFRPDVERLPIFGFGCGGGVAGLARAYQIARAQTGKIVLFLTVDLCSLCMRINDPSLAMFVSSALFGDGAAGIILGSQEGDGNTGDDFALGRIASTGEYFWSDTEHIMGWDIKNDGFGVVLSPELPTLLNDRLGEALNGFLMKNGLTLQDFDGFLLHPGGAKILQTAQGVLGIERNDLRYSWDVLRDYGNMSSATALFILRHAIKSNARGRHLLAAFGPGFSAYFIVIDL